MVKWSLTLGIGEAVTNIEVSGPGGARWVRSIPNTAMGAPQILTRLRSVPKKLDETSLRGIIFCISRALRLM